MPGWSSSRHDANPSRSPLGKKAEAEAIRNNERSKPDFGQLIQRPSLQQAFSWFNDAIVLRKSRGAHPAPAGSTTPVRVGAEEAAQSGWLFRGIVAGWAESMEKTRRRTF